MADATGEGQAEDSNFSEEQETQINREHELLFLRAAELGDHHTILAILQSEECVNPDCVDILGRTALRLAVRNQHIEIVNSLLEKSCPSNVYESLLLSISLDHDAISETIITHPKYKTVQEEKESHVIYLGILTHSIDDTMFSTDVTPLMLAAQKNQFQIVKLLIMLGEEITTPHNPICTCTMCRECSKIDELRVAKARLNAYRGLASPAYITLFGNDPFLTAFLLSKNLKKLASQEKHFYAEYLHLNEQLGDFQVRLLDRVRSEEELDIILNELAGSSVTGVHKMARLKLAIHYEQKKFVAHSYCQKKLASLWYAGIDGNKFMNYKTDNKIVLFLKTVPFVIIYPFLAVVFWVQPYSKVGNFLKTPVLKFTAFAYSYIFFVAIIVAYSANERPSSGHRISEDTIMAPYLEEYMETTTWSPGMPWVRDMYIRNHRIGYGTYVLTIWVIGLIWQDCKELFNTRFDYHFESWFNIFDLTFIILYVTSFTLRYLTLIKVDDAVDYFHKQSSWDALKAGDDDAVYQFYWLDADRYHWDKYDPYVISEALFALGNVLSVCRLAGLLIINEQIGPMIISLSGMAYDIMRFAVFFVLVMGAFIVGFLNLYWYYDPSHRARAEVIEHDLEIEAEESFGELSEIIKTVYWSIFGMAEPSSVEIGSFPFENVTTTVGYLLFGIYNFVTVLVLVNILIAMMAKSYDTVVEDQDVEWKFARTKIYMDFMRSGNTLAVPFNIIPSWKGVQITYAHLCGKQTDDSSEVDEDDLNDGEDNDAFEYETDDIDKEPETKERDSQDTVVGEAQVKGNNDEGNASVEEIDLQPMRRMSVAESVLSDSEKLSEFELVMRKLVRRYLIHVHGSGGVDASVSEESDSQGHHEEVIKNISNLRFELVNTLRRQDKETGVIDAKVQQLWQNVEIVNRKCDMILQLLREEKPGNMNNKIENVNLDGTKSDDETSTGIQSDGTAGSGALSVLGPTPNNDFSSLFSPTSSFSNSRFGLTPISGDQNSLFRMDASSFMASGRTVMNNGTLTSADGFFGRGQISAMSGDGDPSVTTAVASGRLSPASVFADLHGRDISGSSVVTSRRVQQVQRVQRVQHIVKTERKVGVKKVAFSDDENISGVTITELGDDSAA